MNGISWFCFFDFLNNFFPMLKWSTLNNDLIWRIFDIIHNGEVSSHHSLNFLGSYDFWSYDVHEITELFRVISYGGRIVILSFDTIKYIIKLLHDSIWFSYLFHSMSGFQIDYSITHSFPWGIYWLGFFGDRKINFLEIIHTDRLHRKF